MLFFFFLHIFRARVVDPFRAVVFNNYTFFSAPPPSSGIIVDYILQIVNGLVPVRDELLNVHRITEAMKFAFGLRRKMGDPKFVDISEVGIILK